jgi:hypothetical protein
MGRTDLARFLDDAAESIQRAGREPAVRDAIRPPNRRSCPIDARSTPDRREINARSTPDRRPIDARSTLDRR